MSCALLYSSGIIWEEQKKRDRFKALNLGLCDSIEGAYQQHKNEVAVGNTTASRKKIGQKLEVCFAANKGML